MAVKHIRENIITFVYKPEKDDELSCAWARFKLDLDRYSMFIESDCGNYCYIGWKPSPDRESFLHLCQRFNKDYLLDKFSDKTVVDGKETYKQLKRQLDKWASEKNIVKDWEYFNNLQRVCLAQTNVFNACEHIYIYLHNTFAEKYVGLWNLIADSVVTDYPAGAKTIVGIYMQYIVPAIKKFEKEMCNE